MSDTHILIGKQLRYGVEHCGTGTYDVDLSGFTLAEIRHDIVKGMIDEFRPLYTFRINPDKRIVTVAWSPEQTRPLRAAPSADSLTSRITSRRQ